jgi:hypothetical protein
MALFDSKFIGNLFTSLPLPPLIRLHNLSLYFYTLYSQKERVGKRDWSAQCSAFMSNQSRKFQRLPLNS